MQDEIDYEPDFNYKSSCNINISETLRPILMSFKS